MTITPSTDNARADWDENVSQMSETPGNHDSPSRHPVVLHARVVTGEGGGPEKTILNSPRFLTKLGYDAYCAYLREPRDAGFAQIAAPEPGLAAPLIEIDDRGPLDLRVATVLRIVGD